ncbi:MAG: hypothetical protein RLZZ621_86 [Gemmatimonadota bacterium]
MSLNASQQPQRTTRAPRTEDVVRANDASSAEGTNAADFSAVLALLAGNNPQLRADLVKQLPPEGASLVDRLLAGAQGANAAGSAEAAEALRYGLLSATPNGVAGGDSTSALGALASSRGSRGGALTLAALARTATQRGTSVEQLLALGDTQGADMRATLDALLAKAGTAAGVQLANGAAGNATHAVDAPTRDLSDVAPELRGKLERVMERMQAEFGHDVRVVESVRSQERQDWLFEQGRSRDGQVVTWTRDSAHTRGEAVDVIIDGSYGNSEAYARLQQIAREEGLRTLGMKDPGHLELPRGAAVTDAGSSANMMASVNGQAQAGQARPAGVAGVAGIAGVAGVASSASAASPMMASTLSSQLASDSGHRESRQDGDSARRDDLVPSTFGLNTSATFAGTIDPTAATRAVPGVDQSQRIADIDQLRAGANNAPVSRVTLDLPNENGPSERITIDMRGNTINASIVTDADLANRLRMQTADLQDALGRHGLDADSVRISGRAPDAPEGVSGIGDRDALALAGSTSTSNTDTSASQDRERATRQHDRQDDARREPSARDRNDREQQERQQQDRERFLNYLKGVE